MIYDLSVHDNFVLPQLLARLPEGMMSEDGSAPDAIDLAPFKCRRKRKKKKPNNNKKNKTFLFCSPFTKDST